MKNTMESQANKGKKNTAEVRAKKQKKKTTESQAPKGSCGRKNNQALGAWDSGIFFFSLLDCTPWSCSCPC